MDHGGSTAELPQSPTTGELSDDRRLRLGEAEVGDRGVELVGGLPKDDLGGRVGQESAAILLVAVPSSAWATRSEARWVMQRLATP